MSKVFVVQNVCWKHPQTGRWESKFDFSSAGEFGTLEFLLDPDANPFNTTQISMLLMEKLGDYKDTDYLLLVGNPVLIGLAVATAMAYNSGKVQLLQWDRRRKYIPFSVDLPIFR